MNQSENNKSGLQSSRLRRWLTPPKHVETLIHIVVILVGILEIIIGCIGLLKHGTAAVIQPLLVIVALVACSVCFWIYTARDPSRVDRDSRIPQYSPRARRTAAVGFIVILIIPIVFYLVRFIPTRDFVILVADFDDLHQLQHYRVTDFLLLELRKAEGANVRVVPLGEPISERDGSTVARKKGAARKASLVLWGWYEASPEAAAITIHIELLRPFRMVRFDRVSLDSLNSSPTDLTHFTFQVELGKQLTYLVFMMLGTKELESGEWDRAITYFTKSLGQETDAPNRLAPADVFHLRAFAYRGAGNFAEALADLDKALAINPGSAGALNDRAATLSLVGRSDEAMNDYNKAIAVSPRFVVAYTNRGNLHYERKEYDEALSDYNHAIELDSSFKVAYNLRGLLYSDIHDTNSALRDLNKAINLDPEYEVAYNNRCLLYVRELKRYDSAINDCNKALKLRSRYPQAYNNRGVAYDLIGEATHAIADYQQAIRIDPTYFSAHRNLGLKYAEMMDFRAATNEIKTAVTLTDDSQERQELVSLLETLEAADRVMQKGLQKPWAPLLPR